MSDQQVNLDVAVKEYRDTRRIYEDLTGRVRQLVAQLLDGQPDIRIHAIESRTKSVDSFSEKIHRNGSIYADPLREVTDLSGLRVIVYYPDDVDKVGQLIDQEFCIDAKNSVDKRAKLATDQFGYLSLHKVVRISESRKALPEWRDATDLVCEIQIRSVLQHGWAAIQHSLEYKSAAEVPREFRRRLVRLAGLLELADEEFVSLRTEREEFVRKVQSQVTTGNLQLEMNADVLKAYLEHPPSALLNLESNILKGRWTISVGGADDVSHLLRASRLLNLRTINDLEAAIERTSTKNITAFFQSMFAHLRTSMVAGGRGHCLAVALLASEGKALTSTAISEAVGWSKSYSSALVNATLESKLT